VQLDVLVVLLCQESAVCSTTKVWRMKGMLDPTEAADGDDPVEFVEE
jgi:hypothetical protein